MGSRLIGPHVAPAPKLFLDANANTPFRRNGRRPVQALPSSASWMKVAVFVVVVVLACGALRSSAAEDSGSSRRTPSLAAGSSTQRRQQTADLRARARAPIATASSRRRSEPASGRSSSGDSDGSRSRSQREMAWAQSDRTGRSESEIDRSAPRRSYRHERRGGGGEDADYSESSEDGEDSYENYDTEEGSERASYDEDDDDNDGHSYVHGTTSGGGGGGWSSSPGDSSGYRNSGSEEYSSSGSEEEKENRSEDGLSDEGRPRRGAVTSNLGRASQFVDSSPRLAQPEEENDNDNAVEVCVVTWNLAEATPSKKDLEFLRRAAAGSGLVAVGVQEIENLKPRRNEGGRTREWRRLLIQTLGRDFVRVGHHAMGAVQLTLFARREILDRVKVVKLTEVVCGVGNVLQNKGGIGAYVRVDRTTFLFVAAHLAAHQGKLEERNAGYWRIVTALDQEIPPAWVTHAARKRAKRAKANAAASSAAAAAATARQDADGAAANALPPPAPLLREALPLSRGPFKDRVDRVFFFGDLNYRVDLSREDIELGVSVCRREEEGTGGKRRGTRIGRRFRPGVTYPGSGRLDALLDFDQLTLARSHDKAFGGFAEARVTFEPTYKYDKGSRQFDTSRKMRPPAWTDRILFSPPGPLGVSSLAYESVPGSCHSDHRPVFAKFKVQLAE